MNNIPEALREFAMAERKRQGSMLHPVFEADLATEAANEIEKLRKALNSVAVVHHVRMAEGGGTVPSGYSCEICQVECGGKLSELRHLSTCPLFPLNYKQ